ncbi:MAG: PulJ/GspJ family protein [Pseudomonadota bacterium]
MKNLQRGFTLIELLITLAILSLVLFSGTYAYQFMNDNWQRNKVSYQNTLTELQSWRIVTTALKNTAPKLVKEETKVGFYFLGRENGFTAYTNVSVQQPDYPAVYRLIIEPSEKHSGDWQLVYEEAPLTNTLLEEPEQTLPFNYRVVLMDTVSNISLSYYGWENASQRIMAQSEFANQVTSPEWYREYDGFSRNQHPTLIKVFIDEFEWTIAVPDRGTEMQQQMAPDDV